MRLKLNHGTTPGLEHQFKKIGEYAGLEVSVCELCGLTAKRGDTISAECPKEWD